MGCLLGLPAALALLALLYFHSPESPGSFWPRCLFHALTGLYCPGCGGTRALYWLLHGEFFRSLRYNLLLLPMGGYLLGLLWVPSLSRRTDLACGVAAVLLLFFLLRNLPWFPFSLLAPLGG